MRLALVLAVALTLGACGGAEDAGGKAGTAPLPDLRVDEGVTFEKELGAHSPYVRERDGRTEMWASGGLSDPASVWFDMTGAPITFDKLQYGIGRDKLPPIDEPVYVPADDPRLVDDDLSFTDYGDLRYEDDAPVIGIHWRGVTRAYHERYLHFHEILNDTFEGLPVTVGW